jgi:hypothetical protein
MNVERPEGLIEDAGRRGDPRRLDQMISARLDPLLVAALKKLADARGVSLSDVLRDAVVQMLAREEAQNVRTFRVEVTNDTRPEAKHQSYRQDVPVAVLQSRASITKSTHRSVQRRTEPAARRTPLASTCGSPPAGPYLTPPRSALSRQVFLQQGQSSSTPCTSQKDTTPAAANRRTTAAYSSPEMPGLPLKTRSRCRNAHSCQQSKAT